MLSALFHRSAASAADFTHLRQASVELRNVIKQYDAHSVLNGVSLAVEAGEVVTILGPSGSGKSTLIRLINQLESLSGGEIFIDGKPISQLRGAALRQLRSRIGFVFQQFNLYSHLTALQNIALALEYVHGWNKTEADRRALELLEKVGLAEKANAYAAQLSGGQQQRVCIARVLAVNPEIILLDEPTSALDPVSTGKIESMLLELRERYTMIIVTHNMSQASRISDKTAFFLDGHLIEYNDTKKIFMNPEKQETEDYISGRFG